MFVIDGLFRLPRRTLNLRRLSAGELTYVPARHCEARYSNLKTRHASRSNLMTILGLLVCRGLPHVSKCFKILQADLAMTLRRKGNVSG